jgi:dynein regulatory complex protein 1
MGDTAAEAERQERVKERRARIEQRILSRDEDGNKNKRDVPERKQLSRGKQQIADSLVNLDKKKSTTIHHVTAIRVDTDSAENSRRIGEEDRRQNRLQTLQEEAVNSGKQNATVEMKWAELMEYNMPQELMREMQGQQGLCEGIISSKNKLITDFQCELKRKDDEYVKSLKQQNDDVEDLLARMARQYTVLQEEYSHELEAIETAFLKEREELLDDNKNEMDSLFDRRRTMETHFMEARQEREDRYQNELQELRAKDAEDYNKLKIKLETDIQTLEQQLEEMRATYQLNTEKLEYNYRVLTEVSRWSAVDMFVLVCLFNVGRRERRQQLSG